jgi:hypothetical protein
MFADHLQADAPHLQPFGIRVVIRLEGLDDPITHRCGRDQKRHCRQRGNGAEPSRTARRNVNYDQKHGAQPECAREAQQYRQAVNSERGAQPPPVFGIPVVVTEHRRENKDFDDGENHPVVEKAAGAQIQRRVRVGHQPVPVADRMYHKAGDERYGTRRCRNKSNSPNCQPVLWFG